MAERCRVWQPNSARLGRAPPLDILLGLRQRLGIFAPEVFSSESGRGGSAAFMDLVTLGMFGIVLHDFWPSRFGALFSCVKPTERAHPYSEFGM